MIKKIQCNKIFSKNILKNSFSRKSCKKQLPIVDKPVLFYAMFMEPELKPEEPTWGELFSDLFGFKSRRIKKQQELARQKQLEAERIRQRELEARRQAELERIRLQQLEEQKQAELEKIRLQRLEEQRQAELSKAQERQVTVKKRKQQTKVVKSVKKSQQFQKKCLIYQESVQEKALKEEKIRERKIECAKLQKEYDLMRAQDLRRQEAARQKNKEGLRSQSVISTTKKVLQQKTETKKIGNIVSSEASLEKLCCYAKLAIKSIFKLPEIDSLLSGKIQKVNNMINNITETIERAKMMAQLKTAFTKGADYFVPSDYKSNFNMANLIKIIPQNVPKNNSKKYKRELERLCRIFCKNSVITEKPINSFNIMSQNFFKHAAQSIKEIFDLQKNRPNRLLERIPKLGLIPKALRIGEQLILTNCVMGDFKDLSKNYVNGYLNPFFEKYSQQYKSIEEFTNRYLDYLSEEDKVFTYNLLDKTKKMHDKRLATANNVLNYFAKGGMNISNICKNVRIRGGIELVSKTVSTFATLF